MLIDFGTARAFAAGKTVKQTAMLTPGYAPLEQYGQQARFGSFSDVYALGATLYHCLTGRMPPPATDRISGVEVPAPDIVNPAISPGVSRAVMHAMQIKAAERPQSMKEFVAELEMPAAPASSQRPPGAYFFWRHGPNVDAIWWHGAPPDAIGYARREW